MFRNYLSAALSNLERNRLYAALTILGLAVGFASAIIAGLYLRHELTYDQFIPGYRQVFLVNLQTKGQGDRPVSLDDTAPDLAQDLKLYFPQIQYTARLYGGLPPAVQHGQVNVSERAFFWVDPDFFRVFPLPSLAGNLQTAVEAPDGVVLTRTAARKYFGRDTPVGETLLVNNHPMRVAAVMEDLPSNTHLTGDVFASSLAGFSAIKQLATKPYASNFVSTYVRLKPGASARTVQMALADFVARRVAPAISANAADPSFHYRLVLKPLARIHLEPSDGGDYKPGADVKVLFGIGVIATLIVVVAGINFVTLMTARASRRAKEVAVRKALGAQRGDLMVQFMGEAMTYVTVSMVVAVALAEILLPPVNVALQRQITFHYLRDPALLAAIAGVTLLTGVLAGTYPALVLSAFRPAAVLKGGPITAGGDGVRRVLVVAQFAVLIVLIFSTLTIYRQTIFALKDATHTNKDNVVMLFASPCTDVLRDAIASLPGVRQAACASPAAVGLNETSDMVQHKGRDIALENAQVDFGFFEVYGIRPVAGRVFRTNQPGDDGTGLTDSAPPIVVNESAARSLGYTSPSAAVGQTISWHFNPKASVATLVGPQAPLHTSEIIGVVPDFTFGSIRQPIHATFYYVGAKIDYMSSIGLNVKLDGARTNEALAGIDHVWRAVSGGQPMQRAFADQFLLRLYIDSVIQGGVIAICALIAVSIACLGLYALSAFTAERRTLEIGVRK